LPDVYATITEAEPAVVEGLVDIRAEQPTTELDHP
jgi:hypothetical protein